MNPQPPRPLPPLAASPVSLATSDPCSLPAPPLCCPLAVDASSGSNPGRPTVSPTCCLQSLGRHGAVKALPAVCVDPQPGAAWGRLGDAAPPDSAPGALEGEEAAGAAGLSMVGSPLGQRPPSHPQP